ncbi:MAG: hypothetical protein JWN76_679 [Chitinophagaceae bacterium]|nr:hypothetical protein [Chitinophagaceae bacterium]
MKKYLLLIALVAFAINTKAQRNEEEPYMTKSLKSDNIKNVEVRTSGGSIGVTGITSGEARIEVYIWPNNSRDGNRITKEEIDRRLQNYDLNISSANNKLTATAKRKKREDDDWKDGLSISFKIFVPVNITTDLSTSGGSIALVNVTGKQDFATSGGSLRIDKVSGNVHGRTSGGSIHVTDSKDDLDLSTSGGSIDARNCKGILKLNTSGGSLNLEQLGGTITAHTSGGSIHGSNIEGDLSTHTSGGSVKLSDLSGSVDASTSGGSMDVTISNPSKFVKLHNSSGSIDVTLPGNKGYDLRLSGNRVKTPTLNNFKGTMDDDSVNGSINGGGIPVTINAGSGRVYLTLK